MDDSDERDGGAQVESAVLVQGAPCITPCSAVQCPALSLGCGSGLDSLNLARLHVGMAVTSSGSGSGSGS